MLNPVVPRDDDHPAGPFLLRLYSPGLVESAVKLARLALLQAVDRAREGLSGVGQGIATGL